MTKYLESSCPQRIFQVIKVRLLPSNQSSLVSTWQARRSPSQSVPTTSSCTHTRGTHVVFTTCRKAIAVWNEKCGKASRCLETLEYFRPLFFCFFLLLLSSLASRRQAFLCSTFSRDTPLPQPSSHPPYIPIHPCTSPYIPIHPYTTPYVPRQPAVPANTQRLAVACPPKRKGGDWNIPPRVSLQRRRQETCHSQRHYWPQESNTGPKSRGSRCSPNTTYCNPLLPPVLIQYRPSWVTRHFEDLTFSHYLSFT